MQSPYGVYNLRRNPFGELTREELASLAVIDKLDQWIAAMRDARTAIQFYGGCGYGKTTHLLAIERRLSKSAYVYYPEFGPRPALPRTRPLLVDEADRMGWRQHWRMLCSDGPIVIATHVDYSWRLRRFGFHVTSVNLEQPILPASIASILNRRVEASRLNDGLPVPVIDNKFAEQLALRFDSNLRRIEHFLYERFQLSLGEKTPWPPAI